MVGCVRQSPLTGGRGGGLGAEQESGETGSRLRSTVRSWRTSAGS